MTNLVTLLFIRRDEVNRCDALCTCVGSNLNITTNSPDFLIQTIFLSIISTNIYLLASVQETGIIVPDVHSVNAFKL